MELQLFGIRRLINILPLTTAGSAAVEMVLDRAFGADRHNRTAYRMRAGMEPIAELSFAAFDNSALVGTLQSWPIQLSSEKGEIQPMIMVGPVAVLPERQRSGIGVALMNHMLAAADTRGEDALLLIGDPEYYDRLFGFNADHTANWEVPGLVERHRVLARLRGDRLHRHKGMLGPAGAEATILR